jgi:glycosyltransferase involved in cell wall biosynthesis
MHIVLVTPEYPGPGSWGGLATYTRTHARALRRAGHTVTIVTGSGGTTAAPPSATDGRGIEREDDGVHLLAEVPPVTAPRSERRRAVADIVSRLIATDPSIVVEGPELDGLLLDLQRRLPQLPVVVRLHGSRTQLLASAATPWRRAARRLLPAGAARRIEREERESVARAAAVTGPTQWALATLRERGWTLPRRCVVIPNPMVMHGVSSASGPVAVPPADAPASGRGAGTAVARRGETVLFFGRLDPLKGVDRYLAIWRAIWRRRPAATIAVLGQDGRHLGGGSWREHLERQLRPAEAPHVEWLGGRPPQDIPALLERFAVAAFCSPFETFGYTIVEAMRHGVACVVGSGGGASELGAHGTHLLLTSRTPEDIADGTCQLLEQPLTAALLGAAAATHVAEAFAADRVATRSLALYATLPGDVGVHAGTASAA